MRTYILNSPVFKNRYSYILDGVNEYLNTNKVFPFERNVSFSFTFFIKVSNNFNMIYQNMLSDTTDPGVMVYIEARGIRFVLQKSSVVRISITTPTFVLTTGWNYVTINYNGDSNANNCSIYLNGANQSFTVASNTLTLNTVSATNGFIGRFNNGSGYSGITLNQFILKSGLVTLAEHTSMYNNGKPKNPRKFFTPQLLYLFNDDSFDGTNWIVRDKYEATLGASVNMEEADRLINSPY